MFAQIRGADRKASVALAVIAEASGGDICAKVKLPVSRLLVILCA